ncbi:hypothetical protein QLS91_13790 [Flavobacterium sp. LB2P84]|uniref:hypothetical protein n=1 Tax=Flavobacterium yafengii TaxID=3041253 RepID=UPI0024A9E04A|nr:hypothetical protein [Flavobacterium yafengii]MDI6034148.1 hypothetical protein [Flavobacterium yafengii]
MNGFQGSVRVDKGLFTLFYYIVPYSLAYVFHNDAVYYLFGVVFNSVILCLSIHYLFKSLDLMNFSTKSKFWTVLVLNLFPIHVYYGFGILAETGSFFAVCLFVYFWVKITIGKSYSFADFILLAFSIGMLIGFRPNLFPFVFLFLVYFLILKLENKYKVVFISTLFGILLFLTSAEGRLSATDGDFKKEIFRKQLLWSRFELRDEPFNWLPQHGQDEFVSSDYLNNLLKRRELDSICELQKLDKTAYYIDWVADDILTHPLLTLRQYSLKFFQSQSFIISPLMKSNKSNWIKYGIHFYINSINYVLIFSSIFGVFLLIKIRTYRLLIPFLFLWFWSLLYVFVFHSEQRYMFPMRPVLVFLFAFTINTYCDLKSQVKE